MIEGWASWLSRRSNLLRIKDFHRTFYVKDLSPSSLKDGLLVGLVGFPSRGSFKTKNNHGVVGI